MKMRSLLLSMLLVCLGYTASAQMYGKKSGSDIGFGIRAGATFSTINSENEGDVEMKSTTGLQIGAVTNFAFSEVLSLQPELLFIQKGSKATYEYEESFPDFKVREEGTFELKSNYVELPVLLKATFGTGDVNFFFTGGPTVGYWVSGREKVQYNAIYTDGIDRFEESENSDDAIEFDDDDKRVELGGSIGLGVAYKLGTGALNLDVRYGMGFTDIYKTDGNEQAKNRVIGISLAYIFGR